MTVRLAERISLISTGKDLQSVSAKTVLNFLPSSILISYYRSGFFLQTTNILSISNCRTLKIPQINIRRLATAGNSKPAWTSSKKSCKGTHASSHPSTSATHAASASKASSVTRPSHHSLSHSRSPLPSSLRNISKQETAKAATQMLKLKLPCLSRIRAQERRAFRLQVRRWSICQRGWAARLRRIRRRLRQSREGEPYRKIITRLRLELCEILTLQHQDSNAHNPGWHLNYLSPTTSPTPQPQPTSPHRLPSRPMTSCIPSQPFILLISTPGAQSSTGVLRSPRSSAQQPSPQVPECSSTPSSPHPYASAPTPG
jgi:hypothetical protein